MLIQALGPAGTFGHEAAEIAARKLQEEYGKLDVSFQKLNTDIPPVVEFHRSLGVVPIWNSKAGLVRSVTDFWLKRVEGMEAHVIGEVTLRVEHNLLVHPSITRRRQIKAVMSHPHALRQSGQMLNKLRIRQRVESTSTAEAARLVARVHKYRSTAAVASRLAARTHGLKVFKQNVEDSKENFTTFHILGPHPQQQTQADRSAVILIPRGLRGLIQALHEVDFGDVMSHWLTSIGPADAPDSALYMEFDAHRSSPEGRTILGDMRRIGEVKVLGSFPREK